METETKKDDLIEELYKDDEIVEEIPEEDIPLVVCETKEQFIEYMNNYYKPVCKFAASIKKRVRKHNRQMIIAMTGRVRTGKSSFAAILGILTDPKYDIEKNVSFIPDGDTIKKDFKNLPKFSFYHVDEAIRGLYKMDFASAFQKTIVQLYNTEAWRNIITSLCIPRFKSLTKEFRNDIVDYWLHTPTRGRIVIFAREDTPWIEDPWNDKNAQEDYYKRIKKSKTMFEVSDDFKLDIYKNNRNYFTDFNFPDLSKVFPSFFKLYEEAKMKSRDVEDNDAVPELKGNAKKWVAQRNELIKYLRLEEHLTLDEIAKIGKMSPNLVKDVIAPLGTGHVKKLRDKKLREKALASNGDSHSQNSSKTQLEAIRTKILKDSQEVKPETL